MTITRYTSEWNAATAVLVAYGVLGLLLVLLPMPSGWMIPQIEQLPMIQAMQHRAFNAARFVFFWQWMIIAFPIMLLGFSLVAPIKLSKEKSNTWYAIPISILAFAFFGFFTLVFVHAVFFDDLSVRTRIVNVIISAGRSPLSLFYNGSGLMIMALAAAWYSCVLIPIGFYKLIKLHCNR